jgi:hypothetical protein
MGKRSERRARSAARGRTTEIAGEAGPRAVATAGDDAPSARGRATGPRVHAALASKTDEALREEARAHLARHAPLQVVAEVLIRLRGADLAWWTPEQLRARWGAHARLGWFEQRADLRQEITTALTGLVANTARRKPAAFQADLIDAVIEDSDIGVRHFEGAFDPRDVVVYGPVAEIWDEVIHRVPWEASGADLPPRLIESLLEALVTDRSAPFGLSRTPVLTPWELRDAIDTRVWQQRLPLDVRVVVEEARLGHDERIPASFRARDDGPGAALRVIAEAIPLAELRHAFVAAGEAMGFVRKIASGVVPRDVGTAGRQGAA